MTTTPTDPVRPSILTSACRHHPRRRQTIAAAARRAVRAHDRLCQWTVRALRAVAGTRIARAASVAVLTTVVIALTASPGFAAPLGELLVAAPPANLTQVIENLRNWIVGILAVLATLFLTIGGLRYLAAGGDPGEVERAKSALRSAAIGYALAILAPLLFAVLQGIVG